MRPKKIDMRLLLSVLLVLAAASASAQQSYLINWDEVAEESIDHLVKLIRIDTSNPPGNETAVVQYLEDVLSAEGIGSETYALEKERANLVARIKGNGSKRPILIMGHTDVVGVQADKWSEDPFAGVRKDGFVYGRGTLDDKDNVAAGLMVMMLLKRYGV
jgi:acetylornithine deacetylase/succinyl-diaminopimelate desuccinylase-like protein